MNSSPCGAGQAGPWSVRREPRRRGYLPSTPTRIPTLQRAFLDALRGAVAQGEVSPAHLAYLEDRVRVHAGQPQLYGTQFTVTDGEFGALRFGALIDHLQRQCLASPPGGRPGLLCAFVRSDEPWSWVLPVSVFG